MVQHLTQPCLIEISLLSECCIPTASRLKYWGILGFLVRASQSTTREILCLLAYYGSDEALGPIAVNF